MNSVQLIGTLVRDVELKYSNGGMAIASIDIAVNKKVKNSSGEYENKGMFFDVKAFGKTAENINKFFNKGSRIGITGELDFETWQDQSGGKRSKVSIICQQFDFIDKREHVEQQGGHNAHQQASQHTDYQKPQQRQAMPSQLPEIDIDEDEIPF